MESPSTYPWLVFLCLFSATINNISTTYRALDLLWALRIQLVTRQSMSPTSWNLGLWWKSGKKKGMMLSTLGDIGAGLGIRRGGLGLDSSP